LQVGDPGVGGGAVVDLDPAIIADTTTSEPAESGTQPAPASSENVQAAFG
jgi:hypothetical protein